MPPRWVSPSSPSPGRRSRPPARTTWTSACRTCTHSPSATTPTTWPTHTRCSSTWRTRANGGEPDAGRRLLSWTRQAGFTDVTATSSTWCYATAEDRAWWGGLWAERITGSALARQLVDQGYATTADLQRLSAGWRSWAAAEDGWFSLLHGEILCRVS